MRKLLMMLIGDWVPYTAAVIVTAVLLATAYVVRIDRWQVLIAFLPFFIVLYHALNLRRERPRFEGLEPLGKTSTKPSEMLSRVQKSIEAYYGADTIVARYVLPAALLPLVGLWEFHFISVPGDFSVKLGDQLYWPFEYGLVGAYVFVFLDLGKRAVRNDITPVSILWWLTTLVVGPALAALLPTLFTPGIFAPGISHPSSAATGGQLPTWGERAIWIFAGYSPRIVLRSLERGVRRMLQEEEPVPNDHRLALTRLSGIGPEEAARLAEEGIRDVHGLACVDPVRLMRDTRFDNWQILSWVDRALLAYWVEENVWQELLRRGFQRATDLCGRPDGEPARPVLDVGEGDAILEEIHKATGTTLPVLKHELTKLVEDPRTCACLVLARALAREPPLPEQPVQPPTATAGGLQQQASGI